MAVICFAVSIPVGISLGQVLCGKEGAITLFGQNLLDLFDIITNTVLMPVCAFFSCVAIGWILGPKKALREMKEDGQKLGWFAPIFSVMVKYVTPVLIAVIEVFGVYDLIFPKNTEGLRVFSSNGLGITLCAYGLLAVGAVIYFIFLRSSSCGTNADEEA